MSNRELHRLAGLLEQLLDANEADARTAFEYRRNTFESIRGLEEWLRTRLDAIERKIGEKIQAPTADKSPLQQLADGKVPVKWFIAAARFVWRYGILQTAAGAGLLELLHRLHIV